MTQGQNFERLLRAPAGPGAPSVQNAPSPGRISRRTLFTLGGLTIVGIGAGTARASAASSDDSSVLELRGDSHPGNAATLGTGVPEAPSRFDGGGVQTSPEYYVHAGQNVIALTIDDGPDPTYTPQVLEVLREYGTLASFCMIGEQVPGNESLVTDVSVDGHMICNHTWDHSDQTKLSADQVADQIERTNKALRTVGITPTVYRAPYGNWNSTVFQACADANLRPVDWSVDPVDWSMPGVDSIVNNIMTNTKSGSIILEHDGGGDRSQTVSALKIVLPRLLNKGYSFTTV